MNARLHEATILETPTLPPTSGAPPSHPMPLPMMELRTAEETSVNSCEALTSAAIEAVINLIIASHKKALSDVAAHGTTGSYASAARDNLAYLREARDKMQVLLAWLYSAGVLGLPPAAPLFVTNASGAYTFHGYVRETVISLHYARHWATISTVYHMSGDARASYELTSQALDLLESLGAQAGRCYMGAYVV